MLGPAATVATYHYGQRPSPARHQLEIPAFLIPLPIPKPGLILAGLHRRIRCESSAPRITWTLAARRIPSTRRHNWIRRPVRLGGSRACGQMAPMVDKGGSKPAPRTGRERIQKLAQAALNADVTVEQVDTILEGLSETLVDLNNSTGNLDATLERFNDTINQINELAPRLIAVVDRMEGIVARVERIVGVGESVISPLAATEQAVRDAVNRVRKTTGL